MLQGNQTTIEIDSELSKPFIKDIPSCFDVSLSLSQLRFSAMLWIDQLSPNIEALEKATINTPATANLMRCCSADASQRYSSFESILIANAAIV